MSKKHQRGNREAKKPKQPKKVVTETPGVLSSKSLQLSSLIGAKKKT